MCGSGRPGKLRIVLADDHRQVREEIRLLLSAEYEVVSVVGDGHGLLDAATAERPDVVVCDIEMPGLDGINAGRLILEGGFSTAVVLLTMHNDRTLLQKATRTGIRGFVLKVDAGEELIAAVREVAAGRSYMSNSVRSMWQAIAL